MLKLNEVLKASKLGGGAPDYWTQLFSEHVGGKGDWKIAELTGALPLTFRSNGAALINYRIYGTADGAGVQTENLFNKNAPYTSGKYLNASGAEVSGETWGISEYIPIEGNTTYTAYNLRGGRASACWYDENKNFIAGTSYDGDVTKSFSLSSSARYIRLTLMIINPSNIDTLMLIKGTISPSEYIPYGYEIPLTVTSGTGSKDTDIYIGDSKLLSGDYVDYESGKIVRNGTPQDPPLPLPAIETFNGENTLDSTETLGEVTIKGKIKEAE